MPSTSDEGHEHGPGCGCVGPYFGLLIAGVVVGAVALGWWVFAF